jgi:hypothetical protein
MTDRELLEFAAKAAGLEFDRSPHNGGGSGNTGFDMMGNAVLDWHNNTIWNPLTDDGDALRLAVKLRIKFRYSEVLGQGLACTGRSPDFEAQANIEDFGRDEVACVRRAIVRAAAEIGKASI